MFTGSTVLIIHSNRKRGIDLCDLFASDGCTRVYWTRNPASAVQFVLNLDSQYSGAVIVEDVIAQRNEWFIHEIRRLSPSSLTGILLASDIPRWDHDDFDDVVFEPAAFASLRNAVRNGLTNIIRRKALEFVVPVLGLKNTHPNISVMSGGSGCLVDTGETTVLLTASHVVRAIMDSKYDWVLAGIGKVIALKNWSVAEDDPEHDIATLSPPADFAPFQIGRKFYRPLFWPPVRAKVDEIAFMLGFPGTLREVQGTNIVTTDISFTQNVSSVSEDQFVLASGELPRQSNSETLASLLTSAGGISGAPVFVNRDNGLELCGVVKEGLQSGTNTPFLATHADFIHR